jgi:hypothetical protein
MCGGGNKGALVSQPYRQVAMIVLGQKRAITGSFFMAVE